MKQTLLHLSHINSVPVAQGEISVVLSDDAEDMMRHAASVALATKRAGAGVMLINCGMSTRRFNTYMEPHKPKRDIHYYHPDARSKETKLVVYDSVIGNLVDDIESVGEMIVHADVSLVIIMGWEWTSSSSRRKERLLFALREMVTNRHLAVIVYSQATTNPKAGKADRGGLGRLAQIAIAITKQNEIEKIESEIPQAPLKVTNVDDLKPETRESARLSNNKINELQGKIAEPETRKLSDWYVTPEGVLVPGEEADEVCV